MLLCTGSHADNHFGVSAPARELHMPGGTSLCSESNVHADHACRLELPCCSEKLVAVTARQVADTEDMWVRKLEELVQRGIIPHPCTLGK